jgi:hypothetical protein
MASIWASGMSSRTTVFVIGCLAAALELTAGEDPVATFIAAQFEAPVAASSLAVSGEVSRLCAEVLGRPYPHGSIQHCGDAEKTVWILSAQGKHGLITAGFIVTAGRILETSVLADRERRGRPIRTRRFLRQFDGVGLRDNTRLDQRIDGITGATISSNAMEKMALLALRLDALCRDGDGRGTTDK